MTMTQRAVALAAAMLATAPATPVAPEYWSASWAASPAPPLAASPGLPAGAMARAFKDQTIVQIVHLSSGGTGLRLRFTNEYGMKPLRIGAAQVALVDANRGTIGGTERTVTFGGHAGALIPAGAPWVSDPIDLPVPTGSRLQIGLYLPEDTGLCTCHADGGETATISPEGDFTGKPFTASATFTARAFLSEVDVRAASARPVVVAFGDSITDGYLSSVDKDRRWPDRLAERLAANPRFQNFGVANAGIGGNRILADGVIALFGQSAVGRFDRDVLSVPAVSTVIMLEGINDIGNGLDDPTAVDRLIGGYRQIIARAHARGIRILGGTILPYEGAKYHRPKGEMVRHALNRWILTSGAFDGTVDFDKAIRDPSHPSRMRADLQSGDWLHPNDAGYRMMGDAVTLSALR